MPAAKQWSGALVMDPCCSWFFTKLEQKTARSLKCKSLRKRQYSDKIVLGAQPLQVDREFPFIRTDAFKVLLFFWEHPSAHTLVWQVVKYRPSSWQTVYQQVFLQLAWTWKIISHKSCVTHVCSPDHSQQFWANMLYFFIQEPSEGTTSHWCDPSSSIVILKALAHSYNSILLRL